MENIQQKHIGNVRADRIYNGWTERNVAQSRDIEHPPLAETWAARGIQFEEVEPASDSISTEQLLKMGYVGVNLLVAKPEDHPAEKE